MRFELKHFVRFSKGIALPLALMAAFASVSACTSAGSSSAPEAAAAAAVPVARTLEIAITAAADLNPGPSGKPAPLSMQIYVLKSTGRFQSLDFFALKNGGAGALGGDAVDTSVVSVRPGETKTVTVSSGLDGSYIGVAAGYREIDNAKWQAQTGIGSADKFAITVGKSSVSISQR